MCLKIKTICANVWITANGEGYMIWQQLDLLKDFKKACDRRERELDKVVEEEMEKEANIYEIG